MYIDKPNYNFIVGFYEEVFFEYFLEKYPNNDKYYFIYPFHSLDIKNSAKYHLFCNKKGIELNFFDFVLFDKTSIDNEDYFVFLKDSFINLFSYLNKFEEINNIIPMDDFNDILNYTIECDFMRFRNLLK